MFEIQLFSRKTDFKKRGKQKIVEHEFQHQIFSKIVIFKFKNVNKKKYVLKFQNRYRAKKLGFEEKSVFSNKHSFLENRKSQE